MLPRIKEKIKHAILRFGINRSPITDTLNTIREMMPQKERFKLYLGELAADIEAEDRYLLLDFKAGYGRESDRVSYQTKYINFDIRAGERVLDIGSGAYPFPHATHLVDLYEGETTHRMETLVKDDRPFKVCNIEDLPYTDKEFDFVYCSHVLEHVSDPAKACEEIMRVGKKGYLETPTRMSDIMFNFTKLPRLHKWHVGLLGNTLLFLEWSDSELRDTGCDDFYKMFISKYKNPFQDLMYENRDLFNNMLLWNKEFFYYVFDKNGDLIVNNKGDA